MAKRMIPCDHCGFMITLKEYKHNNGICFECRHYDEYYDDLVSHNELNFDEEL